MWIILNLLEGDNYHLRNICQDILLNIFLKKQIDQQWFFEFYLKRIKDKTVNVSIKALKCLSKMVEENLIF